MEEQHNGDPIRDVDATSDPTSSTTLSSSELTLRFPRPQGNKHLASWISSSEPDIMDPSSTTEDAGELAESTYEFINTDDDIESQDDRGTEAEAESLSSFDYARPDDVHSLDGIERTDDTASRSDMESDDDDAAEDRSRASSIQYAEESLMNPSSRVATPPLDADGAGHASSYSNKTALLRQPIEFDETENPICIKQVSVKHVTHHFPEPNPRQVAYVSVRQTMAPSCLDTNGPFRVVYVGNRGAKADIEEKILSALAASERRRATEDASPTSSSVSLEVDHCTAATETVHQREQFPGEIVYSITINHDRTFQSAFVSSGSLNQPSWNPPHVAIFNVTDNDDETSRKTREAAWEFMQRHAVPCIFISDTELFQNPTESWSDMINEHALHRYVEFTDQACPSVRLPIGLETFKEIDDRQMNRNLAYLTGLCKTVEEYQPHRCSNVYAQSMKAFRDVHQFTVSTLEDVDLWTLAQTFGLSIIVATALVLSNWYIGGSSALVPAGTTALFSSAPVVSTATASVSTSTITINLTSTTTIRVPQAKASSSNTAVAPFAELADFIADRFPESQKTYVCSAEKYSHNEILVKIPSGTKITWLAKDSITIDVLKGDQAVKTKFSSIDEGILIEIPRKEAHGVLTIAVNTTKKPKVNETFLIDFGQTALEQCLGYGKSIAHQLVDLANTAGQQGAEQIASLGSWKTSITEDMREVSARLSKDTEKTVNYIKNWWTPAKLTKALQDVRQSRQAQETMEWADMKHKRAQIQSWLLWLRLTRQTEKHNTYLEKAQKYLANKKLAAEKANKERLDRERLEQRARRKRERLEARCQSGFSRWTQQCKQQG
ncbi:uncharacterized protein CTRU02_214117 [Colletotrichum truncatum]|uniref:Uncharacterized protein n=1 Tax=Colletotrichum truncatum TaxID=5467 RepID=A0ACC3YJK1_COLTU|nr:uncharacterized protein CTRU02_06428 [Colletotrichum truncatum]KAF6792932.1 hypothetical protein CTRU02_06428 [Colletotrichum truncatum]